jgi:PTH1 family peptidyl-tRNA hydrolase
MRKFLFRRRRAQEEAGGEPPRLVFGLGNPGGEYLATRHNVGFEVVELIAARAGARFRRGRFRCVQAEVHLAGARVILIQPRTFMNRSGVTVRGVVNYYKTPLSHILVICDDVHLPPGKLRLRRSGSAGGHNGMTSIIQALGSSEFARLRVGVGEPPPHMSQIDYVLGRFEREEREEVAGAIARAADAVEVWIGEGIEAAMNRFN